MNINNCVLPKIERVGLALDIDETLSWTNGYWFGKMQKLFGNPENLSLIEMIKKYRYSQNVPYWKSSETLSWMEEQRHSNELQTKLELINGADIYVGKINTIIPIVAYLTIRPESVLEGTRTWLDKYNFPKAPVICRPSHIPTSEGHRWKAITLERLHPSVIGIIDDNDSILNFLSKSYVGKIFIYDTTYLNYSTNLDVTICKDWETVYINVKKLF